MRSLRSRSRGSGAEQRQSACSQYGSRESRSPAKETGKSALPSRRVAWSGTWQRVEKREISPLGAGRQAARRGSALVAFFATKFLA